MRKIILLFAATFALMCSPAVAQFPTTPHFGFCLPTVGAGGWGSCYNANTALYDTLFWGLENPYQGTWSSSTTYGLGQMVVYSGTTYLSTIASNLNNIPTVTGWLALGGGGGGGGISGLTSGYLPLAGSSTTLTGNSHLDDGVTTAATITSTEPIAVTGGTPGIIGSSLQDTGVTVAGCATFDAAGNLSSTNVACAAVAGVTGINTLTGAVTFSGGSNIALTTVGQNITINGLVNAPTQTEYVPGGPRAVSTVYQNLTNHLLIVTVYFLNTNTGAYGTAYGYEDATSTPVQYAGGCTSPTVVGSVNTPCSFTMEVPPSNYYKVTQAGAFTNYTTWYESTP